MTQTTILVWTLIALAGLPVGYLLAWLWDEILPLALAIGLVWGLGQLVGECAEICELFALMGVQPKQPAGDAGDWCFGCAADRKQDRDAWERMEMTTGRMA